MPVRNPTISSTLRPWLMTYRISSPKPNTATVSMIGLINSLARIPDNRGHQPLEHLRKCATPFRLEQKALITPTPDKAQKGQAGLGDGGVATPPSLHGALSLRNDSDHELGQARPATSVANDQKPKVINEADDGDRLLDQIVMQVQGLCKIAASQSPGH